MVNPLPFCVTKIVGGDYDMQEMKLCSISDEYIEFLREDFPNVYSNKETRRTHTRKYIGVVMQISEYLYYIPMSSPKDTDYQVAGDKKVIKKSIVPIMRMVIKNSKGEKELKGTLRFSHMIPVPETEVEWYDVEQEKDAKYKDLVQNEIIYIRKNQEKIRKSAKLIYKQKAEKIENAKYLNSVLDYKRLEEKCKEFVLTMRLNCIDNAHV